MLVRELMLIGIGGKVVVPKMAVPRMGYFAVCHDTENNSFGIWESNESEK